MMLPILLWIISVTKPGLALAVYTPSDAYQESILKPVHGFSDVAIFHYSVPSQTCKATWTFVAFSDDPSCGERLVHIYLRFGSYPVVTIDNTSFPENVLLPQDLEENQYYIKTYTHFQPKEMPQIDIMNPLPGSWFAIAFILGDDNEAISQQGISRSCHYSLGSMASWSLELNVHLLIPGVPVHVNSLSQVILFKVFVPENTWTVKFKIWGCASASEDTVGLEVGLDNVWECVQSFSVSPDSLPFLTSPLNASLLAENTSEAFLHSLVQPQINVYHYVGVKLRTNFTFKLQVSLEECETSVLDPDWFPSSMTFADVSTSLSSSLSEVRKSGLSREFVSVEKSDNSSETAPKCFPVLSLTRIKHAQDFLDSFLFQGKDWFSSRLKLRDNEPVYVRFEILPFVDIGGTLMTKFLFDEFLWVTPATHVFVVDVCITQKKPAPYAREEGRIECPNEKLNMRLYSNLSESASALRLIPFPGPGTWYITLKASCYNESISNQSKSCQQDEVRLDLRIRLQPCITEGEQCGGHGYCKENHFRHFYFSSCHCTDGWKGWSCANGGEAISPYLTLLQTLLLILSNLFFVPAVYIAIKWKFYAEAVVYLATMFFSSFYHMCDTENIGICLFKYDVLQFCDFYSAILSFWVTVVAMAGLPIAVASMAHMAGALGIALAVQSEKTGLWTFVVPVATGIAIMLLSWGRQCWHSKSFQMTQKLLNLIPGAALVTTGLILFAFLETEGNYKYVHSGWHATIALSITCLLPRNLEVATSEPRGEAPVGPEVSLVVPQPRDSEMIDIGEYRLNSDLTTLLTGAKES